MEKEIKQLHQIIKDYREDEGLGVSEQAIITWINQFPDDEKIFILNELNHIFSKVYFSKERVKKFLKGIIEKLKENFGYSTHRELLDNSNFLDLQAEGKSQKKLLELLFEVLKENFNYNSDNLGSISHKHNIYIDDVLCTGNTSFNNLKDWATEAGKDRLAKLRSKEIDLTVFYMFIAEKYYYKKLGQFYYNVSDDFKNLINVLSIYWFKAAALKPVEENLPDFVYEYKEKVENEANAHAESKGFSSYSSDFFRSDVNTEEFYSSSDNRKRLELIFLKKGIEILRNSNVTMTNIRPLGYSLPAYKDFGFGALIFTWRNVANNTPLVFWYRGGGFTPLFVNKR
ncbi:phosphoribosyltransferase-like protein [Pontibacter sp. MBLB2868]|uniref:phosphoribosyltransferase-like protein n=1 Tax=Pontibacter sp. MBLB2868 TaxID=3451555 RepID=UPI003F74D577